MFSYRVAQGAKSPGVPTMPVDSLGNPDLSPPRHYALTFSGWDAMRVMH